MNRQACPTDLNDTQWELIAPLLKAIAHRPKDMLDIREVVKNNPTLALQRIEYWVKSFADVMETPSLSNEIRKILKVEQ